MKKRKDGRYCMNKIINGKRVFIYGNTEMEVYKKLSELDKPPAVKTFGDIAEEWARVHRDEVGNKTWRNYESTLEQLSPLKKIPMDEITAPDISSIIMKLFKQGYGKSVLLRTRSVVSMIIDFAIGSGIRMYNFSNSIKIPKKAHSEKRESLTDEEISTILNSYNKPYGLYPYFLLMTGLRRGEACGLQWKHVDLKKKVIHIRQSAEYYGNVANIKEPKTESGIRDVPIPSPLADIVQPGKAEDYVFNDSKPMTQQANRYRWLTYLRETGLNVTQHQLRHTYATILSSYVSAKELQGIMGHSDYKTTMNIYSHSQTSAIDNVRKAAEDYVKKSEMKSGN